MYSNSFYCRFLLLTLSLKCIQNPSTPHILTNKLVKKKKPLSSPTSIISIYANCSPCVCLCPPYSLLSTQRTLLKLTSDHLISLLTNFPSRPVEKIKVPTMTCKTLHDLALPPNLTLPYSAPATPAFGLLLKHSQTSSNLKAFTFAVPPPETIFLQMNIVFIFSDPCCF